MNQANLAGNTRIKFGFNILDDEVVNNINNVSIPGVSLEALELTQSGNHNLFSGDTLDFDDLQISMIIDEGYVGWYSLYKSLLSNKNALTTNGDSWVVFTSDNHKDGVKITFRGCLLTNISGFDFDMNSTDDVIVMTLTIKFEDMSIE